MEFYKDKEGNHVLSFKSSIGLDNGFTNRYLGDFDSEMTLFVNEDKTGHIEWVVEELETTELIGLWWNRNNELTDFDGVMELPREAAKLLGQIGVFVSDDFF